MPMSDPAGPLNNDVSITPGIVQFKFKKSLVQGASREKLTTDYPTLASTSDSLLHIVMRLKQLISDLMASSIILKVD